MKKILGLVFGLLFVGTAHAALPSGYTELEYIQSSGTQYINTETVPSTGGYEFDVNVATINGGTSTIMGNQRTAMLYTILGNSIVLYQGSTNVEIATGLVPGVMNNVRLFGASNLSTMLQVGG